MTKDDRHQLSRRGFVQTAALAAGSLGAANLSRAAAADVKIGLYSITYGGVWYRGDALTVEQVIERATKFGYQGVEIDGKRPHGNPLDMPKAAASNSVSWLPIKTSRSTLSPGIMISAAPYRSIAKLSWFICGS